MYVASFSMIMYIKWYYKDFFLMGLWHFGYNGNKLVKLVKTCHIKFPSWSDKCLHLCKKHAPCVNYFTENSRLNDGVRLEIEIDIVKWWLIFVFFQNQFTMAISNHDNQLLASWVMDILKQCNNGQF